MKTLRQLSMAGLLGLFIAASAFAGEMTTMIVPPPPPNSPSAPATRLTESAGDTQGPSLATSALTEVALNLLQSVLAVF